MSYAPIHQQLPRKTIGQMQALAHELVRSPLPKEMTHPDQDRLWEARLVLSGMALLQAFDVDTDDVLVGVCSYTGRIGKGGYAFQRALRVGHRYFSLDEGLLTGTQARAWTRAHKEVSSMNDRTPEFIYTTHMFQALDPEPALGEYLARAQQWRLEHDTPQTSARRVQGVRL